MGKLRSTVGPQKVDGSIREVENRWSDEYIEKEVVQKKIEVVSVTEIKSFWGK